MRINRLEREVIKNRQHCSKSIDSKNLEEPLTKRDNN